uniref:Uncharacterized protein n=1 Tax=Aegilops tauschii subsp. strangulata TaxID=200361 RepID=A0A453CNH2_AEGTS
LFFPSRENQTAHKAQTPEQKRTRERDRHHRRHPPTPSTAPARRLADNPRFKTPIPFALGSSKNGRPRQRGGSCSHGQLLHQDVRDTHLVGVVR